MARCKKITGISSTVCVGDMNKKIKVLTQAITASSTGGYDFTEGYVTLATVWAMVLTLGARNQFDTTQLLDTKATHDFFIRFRTGITQENVIEFGGEYYDILEVWNLQEDSRFMQLRARVRGDKDSRINEA